MNILKLFDLSGKIALVSGASGALGGAAVRGLAAAGATVAACYNANPARLDELLETMGEDAARVRPYQVNAFEQTSIARHADEIIKDFGRLDVVANAAGGNVSGAYFNDGQSIFDTDLQAQVDTVTLNRHRNNNPCRRRVSSAFACLRGFTLQTCVGRV